MIDEFINIMSKIVLVGLMIILSPLIMACFVVMLLTNDLAKKCKYHKVCKLYSSNSQACTRDGGEYPVGMYESKYASCYLKMNNRL